MHSLLQNLKKKQTSENIQALLQDHYTTSLKQLKMHNPETSSTPALRKEFSSYIKNKHDITPCCGLPQSEKIMPFFRSLLHSMPEEHITNVDYIIPFDSAHPAISTGATSPPNSQYAYTIYLAEYLPLYEIYFQLAHELNHTVELDPHRIQKAGCESFGGSIVRKIINHKNIDPFMGQLSRSLELIADTKMIHRLSITDPALAKELCAHGINTISNKIALEALKYMGTDKSGPTETLTSHKADDSHPTWSLRLLLLMKLYEGLQQ